jgi:hypothetical protein
MGLDVAAYRKLTKLDALFDSSGGPVNPSTREPIEDYFKANFNSDFPEQVKALEAQPREQPARFFHDHTLTKARMLITDLQRPRSPS